MKMTKIEFWRKVKENGETCNFVVCEDCPYGKNGDCNCGVLVCIENAEAYIKRHEQKSKKKDHIRDTTKKVEEPRKVVCVERKFYKDISIGSEYIVIEETDKQYKIKNDRTRELFYDKIFFVSPEEYAKSKEPKPANEPTVKENLSVPQPIKFDDPVPDKLYIAYSSFIRCYVVVGGFKKVIDKEMDGSIRETFSIYARPITDGTAEWLTGKECYRTPEEALQVAKKLWNGENE